MATITSTIKLVDQMSPTLNKISKAIDRVNDKANKMGSVKTWGGFNAGARTATKSTHNLYNALRRAVFLVGTLRGLQGLTSVADTMMNATARLNNINDGLYTTSQYLDIIYDSAQRSRGSFSGMVSSVSKLGTVAGDAFNNVNEMIAFTELMNKLFVLSGSSAAEASNAMYQLTQAMAAGKLQGDEMRSILENAPMLAQKIADKLGVTKGEIKELGAKGVITADIIKEALFDAADDIEEKFEKMPKTIGQTWTEIKNHALNAFRPVITAVQNFINSPIFEKFKNRLFSIITSIANAIIRLFEIIESPRVQNAISKICAALTMLWNLALDVGTVMVNVASWICDNWSWLGQIVYAVIAAVLLYKAVMLAVSAAVVIANIAQGVSAWVAGLMAGSVWAWVILIIVALIAIIYLGVAAWNYFTDSTISATGVLIGAIALVGACIWDIVVFIWDLASTIWHVLYFIGASIVAIVLNIGRTFDWLQAVVAAWAFNIGYGMAQLCDQLPLYWESFKASVVAKFWSLVVGAGEALNAMIKGASDCAKAMLQPFENFVNGVIDLLNGLIRKWNQFVGSLSITIPGLSVMGKEIWGEKTLKVSQNVLGLTELEHVSMNDWSDPKGISLGSATFNRDAALLSHAYAQDQIKEINWNIKDYPEYSEYTYWGAIGDLWSDLKTNWGNTWNGDGYVNPFEVGKDWYNKGATLEEGINGFIDGIGALIDGLFGSGNKEHPNLNPNKKNPIDDILEADKAAGGYDLPSSLEDLLGGHSPTGNKLGEIADNTGSSAGSAANIEDTLDLAEEELELLRKLAEQEVINRFTTAEIHVDMTNNNNVSSNMDLDGIVTHLSNKLYEELGVVASGVHY